jgi:hypothetical protein
VNEAKPLWWFEPVNSRFKRKFHLILNNQPIHILYYLCISKNIIQSPATLFYQRADKKDKSQIIITVGDETFTDTKSGFSFKQYLKETIEY